MKIRYVILGAIIMWVIIALIVFFFGTWRQALAGETISNDLMNRQTPVIMEQDTPEVRAKLIKEWVASGEICRVLGHKWEHDSYPNYTYPLSSAKMIQTRKCLTCKKKETLVEEWK